MARVNQTGITEAVLDLPLEGVDETRAYFNQRSGTTANAKNVRAFEPGTDRARIGSREGLTTYFEGELVGEFPVQEINHLVTTDPVVPSTAFGHLSYALTSGNGFGQAGSDGVSDWTAGAVASFAFACSCWDDDNNVYVATVNTTTGATKIYKITSAGVTSWTYTGITVDTGSLSKIAGMVVIGDHLYVAHVQAASPTNRIAKIKKADGGLVNIAWRSVASYATLVFSTSAVNCLGKCGVTLGVECRATGTAQCFMMADTTKSTIHFKTVSYGGTGANNRSQVCSDGTAYFYVIACQTVGMVKKINLGGTAEWSSTACDASVAQSLCYDKSNGFLLVACGATPSVRRLSLTLGTLQSSGDPGSITAWHNIDTDGNGFYTLWRNSLASNDIMGINSTYTTIWGPSTFANTTHDGVSVNKGPVATTPRVSQREIRLFGISGGELKRFDPDGPMSVTTGDGFSVSAVNVFSAQNGNDMYFVDGSRYLRYVASTDTISTWTPTAGSLPVDSLGRRGRLLVTWRGRSVIAGLPDLPQNFYMSKQFEPLDWDYSPTIPSSAQAFSGNASLAGYVGDLINCLIPYSDDTMVFGCDHSIYLMVGDPMVGGELDQVSGLLGMAWGRPWCKDPSGQLYFFGTECGVYLMPPGAPPVPISQQIRKRLQSVNLAETIIQMAWDMRSQGLGLWITPLDETETTENYFWHERTRSWWPDFYGEPAMNPTAVHAFDGDDPDDRVILLGGADGKIRYVDRTASTDDGEKIETELTIGPLSTRQLDELLLTDLQPTMSESSGEVTYSVFVGNTAESALASTAKVTGTWRSGRNNVSPVQRSGFAVYVKLASTNTWALEKLKARYRALGKVRGRQGGNATVA